MFKTILLSLLVSCAIASGADASRTTFLGTEVSVKIPDNWRHHIPEISSHMSGIILFESSPDERYTLYVAEEAPLNSLPAEARKQYRLMSQMDGDPNPMPTTSIPITPPDNLIAEDELVSGTVKMAGEVRQLSTRTRYYGSKDGSWVLVVQLLQILPASEKEEIANFREFSDKLMQSVKFQRKR